MLRDGGVQMTLTTDLPALQVYTAAFFPKPFKPFGAVALEPEAYPDSPNRPDFPSTVLRAGERFRRWAEYRFETAE